MKYLIGLYITLVFALSAFAQEIAPAVADASVSVDQFMVQLLQSIQQLGGLSWVGKLSIVLTLVISSTKVSFLNQMVWSKLGNLKAWAAPCLAVAYCLTLKATEGRLPTPQEALAYFSAGAGAIILHELLDSLKSLPWVGVKAQAAIIFIESTLGKNGNPPAA
jgi:hypothetical protein